MITSDGVLEEFQTYRPLLFGISYRMLGSATEAEDVVQDAYLRFTTAPISEIRSPKAYLTTTVTRLCLDQLKSARVRREQYVGPWLPEPVLTSGEASAPLERAEQRESLSLAFLVLLERLTPPERAVFLLHEVFEYSHTEIAAMLDITPANCRQLFHRAKERIADERPRFEARRDAQQALLERFLAASAEGDLPALTTYLAQDVTLWSDGGGKVAAVRRPIYGRENVLKFLAGLLRLATPDTRLTTAEVNNGPAMLIWLGDRLDTVWTFQIEGDQIKAFRIVRNPDKLAYIRRQVEQRGSSVPTAT